MHDDPTVHVFFGPDHELAAFVDKNLIHGDGILTYRHTNTTGARDKQGRPIPDGWVLTFGSKNWLDEWIIGAWDFDGVDSAVEKSKVYLRQYRRWTGP